MYFYNVVVVVVFAVVINTKNRLFCEMDPNRHLYVKRTQT